MTVTFDQGTTSLTLEYLRPADGASLRAVATVTSATRRRAGCRCDIYSDADGRDPILCVAAQGTTRLVPPS